jgi:hypothetical protein
MVSSISSIQSWRSLRCPKRKQSHNTHSLSSAGSRIVRVRCPTGARPGTSVQITVPEEDRVVRASDDMAVLTSADGDGGGGAVRMNSETRRMNANSETESSSALRAYNVVIPPNVHWPGATFPVSVDGKNSCLVIMYLPFHIMNSSHNFDVYLRTQNNCRMPA